MDADPPRGAGAGEPFAGTFDLPRLERVVSGIDAVETLGAELDRRALSRVLVVTGRTVSASGLVERLAGVLGPRMAGVFAGAEQHVPAGTVHEAALAIDVHRADCVVSLGGGSPIDTVKAALHVNMTDGERPVHVAVPTTLSAGEFTSVAGITDETTRVKHAVRDARLAPRLVITDPTMTVATPDWLWAASGIRAVDHAVETIYAPRRHPLSAALASQALTVLLARLAPSVTASAGERLVHRSHCQVAAWMAVFGMTNAGLGLSHALGHQIGPRWGVAHGFTSCIVLPHAMRLMAQRVPGRFAAIAAGLGVPFDPVRPSAGAEACAGVVEGLVARLGLPQRLRDLAVPPGELAAVARVVHGILQEARASDPPITEPDVAALLAAAY